MLLVFITYHGVIVATLSMLILLILLPLLELEIIFMMLLFLSLFLYFFISLFLYLKIPAEKNGKIEVVFVLLHPSTYRSKTQPSKKNKSTKTNNQSFRERIKKQLCTVNTL